jgi:hypothetical protein
MKLEELKAALDEACLDSYGCGCYDIDNLPEEFELEVVEEDDWVQDYKSQYCTTIVRDNEGNYFQLDNNRQGSYHTDWCYGVPSISQVKRVEKVVTKTVVSWEAV